LRTGSKLGITPLMLAVMNGHTQAVKLLIEAGSDVNVVSLLLDKRANIEHRAKTGLTPLMAAASGGYDQVGRILLERGAVENALPVPTTKDTALTIASEKGHVKFVELLIQYGAQLEAKNKKGAVAGLQCGPLRRRAVSGAEQRRPGLVRLAMHLVLDGRLHE
jgi:ankyrin repeat domain-containing protein 17